jgi:hypothetical protein
LKKVKPKKMNKQANDYQCLEIGCQELESKNQIKRQIIEVGHPSAATSNPFRGFDAKTVPQKVFCGMLLAPQATPDEWV